MKKKSNIKCISLCAIATRIYIFNLVYFVDFIIYYERQKNISIDFDEIFSHDLSNELLRNLNRSNIFFFFFYILAGGIIHLVFVCLSFF